MAKVKDPEHAKILYDYSKIDALMATTNHYVITEEDSERLLGKSIKNASPGVFNGQKNPKEISSSTIPNHIGQLGYFCRVGTQQGQKYVEIWKKELVLSKVIDWSIFEWGTNLPRRFHPRIDQALGSHLAPAKYVDVKVKHDGETYEAIVKNLNYGRQGDNYQLRYDTNKALKKKIQEIFFEDWLDFKKQKEVEKKKGKQKPQVRSQIGSRIELLCSDKEFVFELVLKPGDATQAITETEYFQDLERKVRSSREQGKEQRAKRLEKANPKPETVQTTSIQFKRNPDVIVEVLERASGHCEKCNSPAPFKKASDGAPYLEVHHVIPLSQNGDDTIENAIALCPNCHREAHYG